MSDARVATMHFEVSDMGSLVVLHIVREKMSHEMRELLPVARLYWAASKTSRRTLRIDVLADNGDGSSARALLQRLRKTRKEWKGYFNDIEFFDGLD